MPSVDVRTRTDADIVAVDASEFFGDTLPELFARHAELAAPGAHGLAPRPLAIVVDGASGTLALDGNRPVGHARRRRRDRRGGARR